MGKGEGNDDSAGVRNPSVHPDAPAGGGGPGYFKVPRQPGSLGLGPIEAGQDLVAGWAAPPSKPASTKEMLKGIRNVDRADGKPFDATFDWLSPFEVGGKWVLNPVQPSQMVDKTRQQMLELLGGTRLAQEIFSKLSSQTQKDRAERAAWILGGGKLGPIRRGTVQMVDQGSTPTGAVGLIHTHPSLPGSLEPPTGPGREGDYDSTLKKYPLQFVIESASGRIWGQFLPDLTSLLGRIQSPGSFQPLAATDPVAKLVYQVISVLHWHQIEEDKLKEAMEKERERRIAEDKAKQKPR